MSIEIKAPTFPESVADGTVATWHKKPGEAVQRDELLVDIETDKVVLEVVAPADGMLKNLLKEEGDVVLSDEVLAIFVEGAVEASAPQTSAPAAAASAAPSGDVIMSPAARKIAEENGVQAASIAATGKDGRVTKEDVLNHLKTGDSKPAAPAPSAAPAPKKETPAAPAFVSDGERIEKRVPMTRLRATIARRLVEAQQTAAMLTTYNEVNMAPVMELRKKYKDQFEKKHGVKLGFMSFFVKAATEALKRFPAVNASIDGNDMVYHGYQDIGVAVSTERGLVVPILRDTDGMGLAEVESTIADFGLRARDGKLGIDEMQGGTFTISNGGTFGSLMSTPILNPPQTAIMGMHKIQERPMAVNGQVVILPMMYLALSYDHRMIDGKEAVQFLVTIKDLLEDPARLLLDI
ncbi:2-oxoglutarate dehydrogenase complex dihydrolipoyllysine-residue succinyltransferase [Thalassolituus oleivorans]|uniref:Dihydrolipoyllysine-residue succinyltransferase component of 2-oxoglutarate dehydrogenase complex n=1 Tax=Thalassolituus oleivorans MIL-1 TaxID=1298593 RepID=M5DPR2_9GAMM|nr:2-oxoglutarate dehydrogenase complex dihydrolipoyllysine-residue succinyltransferase [Thalassolituus oleivorans]CCU71920.1 2-oxoglutarate dehydrogenase, E2 component,dihydrolipoamide succinyltransferase [Thalassolituus oleivorans MIL-1]